MQYRKLISVLLILVLVAPWLVEPAGKVHAGASYPVPGNNGLLTIKYVDENSVELQWEYAQSESSTPPDVNYLVYISNAPDLTDVQQISGTSGHPYGDPINGSESNTNGTFSKIITDLIEGDTYYFNVVVKDRYLETAYQMQSIEFTVQLSALDQYNELKKKADRGNSNDFIQDIILLLRNKQFIGTPDFESLPVEDQEAIAEYLLDIEAPTSKGYENKEQVEFFVQLALKALEVTRQIDGPSAVVALNDLYSKQAERINHFDFPSAESNFYQLIAAYLSASEIDKRTTAYLYELKLKKTSSISSVLRDIDTVVEETPFINRANTTEEMVTSLDKLNTIHENILTYNEANPGNPITSFTLDTSKMDNLTPEQKEQLADHMLTERPNGGYASLEDVQTTFNEFFPGNEADALAAVNAAKSNSDNINDMILAMENPDLKINFPNGYYESLQVKKFIAKFLIDYVKNDYKNKDQVQYMVDLGVLAQSIWGQKELDLIQNKLDLFAQQLMDGTKYFNDQQTNVLRSIGQQHLKRSNVDKGVFAYKYLHLLAIEKEEGASKGNIVNPDIVLNLFSMPLDSFENATSIPLMDQWLDHAMNEWLSGEAFFNKYKYRRTGALDLSKRAELSTEGKKELAEWVLNEQDRYEDVGNLQYVINRFFTAPNVTGNDINNTITGLDDTMEISLNGKLNWIDVASITRLDLSGDKTVWVRYKAISDLLPGRAVKIVFTANGDSSNGNGSTPNTGGSTGGGSSATTPVTTTPTTKQEQIVVDVNGANGTNLTKTPITRTTEADGTIKDLVKMSEAIAKESVEKAKQLKMNTARIVIPDAKDAVSETRIELPKAAVKQLNDGGLNLEISTENAIISVPTKSIAGFDQDLYFRVVPLKKESERKEVEERAKKERLIQQITPNSNVKVLARPVEIETNMQSHEVTLTLPLRDSLPTDPAARQQALDNLAVYIEHSDGTKELIQGKRVNLSDSSEGIEFTVNKFSTFTLVVVDGLKASQGSHSPYINGFGADFRPDAFVTRAQMAAMLARNLSDEVGTASANVVNYDDVSATHWAASDIEKAQSAGIMNGMKATQFAPEGSITRAQMATIAYRWIQQQSAGATSSTTQATDGAGFTDVSTDLWSSDAIAYVQSAGLMTGYNDGTFKPDSQLTRAEAVKVLNVLFKRTPVTGVTTPSFTDVPATHWAYADIEAAAQK
ncbi:MULTISPECIES: S-layer homology domain-containing protein [Paenibacillus]|uniref:S-layer family protein n=1 Tax=Paenibacillus pabuli TaxID=1472 RepID=A0A855Y5V1_9BACL|nr:MULTISPECIES: S-layer homology domain-containing protein [Paenibacillus]PWW38001.1 S-layer family protein [Paenibacillus pabuli]PXW08228.1 S-layer family protein [Paenibacillus taichungensis]RAI94381.1 S-layer family protein [Paenibacillus pabuli]